MKPRPSSPPQAHAHNTALRQAPTPATSSGSDASAVAIEAYKRRRASFREQTRQGSQLDQINGLLERAESRGRLSSSIAAMITPPAVPPSPNAPSFASRPTASETAHARGRGGSCCPGGGGATTAARRSPQRDSYNLPRHHTSCWCPHCCLLLHHPLHLHLLLHLQGVRSDTRAQRYRSYVTVSNRAPSPPSSSSSSCCCCCC